MLCSYINSDHVPNDAVATPTFFVCHAWDNTFSSLVDGVSDFITAGADPSKVFLWVDVFAVNQHPWAFRRKALRNLDDAINEAAAMLVVLDNKALTLSRCWCLFEIFSMLRNKGSQEQPWAFRRKALRNLDDAINEAAGMLVILGSKALTLSRCWCLFEIFSMLRNKGSQE
eukprot:gene22603-29744_t